MPTAASNVIQIERPGPPAIVQELSPVVAEANAFAIVDQESHATALRRIQILRSGERKIEEYFEPSRKAADQAKKEILAARDGLVGPFVAARQAYNRKADEYEAEERRKAHEAQRRLEEQARKEEEERKLAEAQAAQDAGDTQLAEEIIQEPVTVAAVRVAPAVAQVEGVSSRTLWDAEVHDLMALIRYVAGHPEWASLLEPSLPNLRRIAIAQREAMSIPGVRAVSRTSRATRG